MSDRDVIVVPPDGGRPVTAFGSTTVFKLEGQQTNGGFCLGFATTPPGAGPPPHVHRRDDELFIVLDGELSFQTSRGWIAAPQGSVVFAPRNAPHTFRNNGSTPSRHVVIALPSGFDEFYARSAEVFAAGGPPDVARLRAIAGEYGYEFLPPGALPA
jgi:quercetin dioxygenase-like cupin family protein